MKRYVKGVLGGLLAILAAFGWTVTLAFAIAWKYQREGQAWGIGAINGPPLWIALFLIFAVGFYFGFRSVYSANSK
jgi:hypothetical protein